MSQTLERTLYPSRSIPTTASGDRQDCHPLFIKEETGWNQHVGRPWAGGLNHTLQGAHKASGGRGGSRPGVQGAACIYASFLSKIGGLETLERRAWLGTLKPEKPKHG